MTVMTKIPLELYMWWEDLGKSGQDRVNLYLGGLTGLLKIRPRGDIIKALVTFWDPAHNVFHFSDFELTPTLEEIAGYIGSTEAPLRHKYLIAPRVVAAHKFLDLLKISRGVQYPDLAAGFSSPQFIYQRYGHIGGFNNPESKICSKGNRIKWEEHRCFAFMVVFLGILVFPRKDGNIDIRIDGVVSTLLTQAKSTLAPMIMSEIFQALTACKAGGDFFEGCNLLLQMWMIEHLCHRPQYMNYGSTGKSCIGEFYTRVDGFSMPERVTEWISRLRSVTANQIEWTFGWLPVDEIIYMLATGPHFLLMGHRSIQPYAPYRVLRQLGRCQIVPKDEDLSLHVVEIRSDGQFHEKVVRQIWSECQYLTANTRVRDLSRGEASLGYLAWYKREVEFGRPAKRPRLQEFVEASQEHWEWLAKENKYRATISSLERQIKDLKFASDVQAAADEGEKKKLAQENEALKAQIQKMRIAARNPERSRVDDRLISGLRKKVLECQDDLEKSEASLARV
ncbi:PREDICTED: uncharacterized protein LOC109221545 [Nicotiana attenuata]|uniref:uncharacterized protein LOC109221545 n=1 Tax=Nicotiana attenuata TaxID=49451 RepID=UPI000904D074|nr:PREDICTED: uncharacterized protein LOC109221545 [Nicotiana attenuata]